eukprot:INCI19880.1.p1 GENE.INCI19880.1~~INCI19880.1.p1  ORF type:complete len:332 (-),score=76.04 INCI19880.1:39-1034(-)
MAFLVTGANKGIGFQIAKALLTQATAPTVFLGSRSVERGSAARASLPEGVQDRCVVVQLDVTDKASIQSAVQTVKSSLGDGAVLQGLVNNAGTGTKGGSFGWTGVEDFDAVVALNFGGLVDTTNAFLPLLNADGGRVVMISSGSAPNFVEKCSEAVQAKLVNPDITLEETAEFLARFRAVGEKVNAEGAETEEALAATDEAFKAAGLTTSTYGASKAAVNCATMYFAKKYPKLKINACSPGFIATDLIAPVADRHGTTAEKMGALPVEKGAICPLFLAVGDVPTPPGQGYYYGSDAKRSPMHKYRSPGSPEYTGEAENVGDAVDGAAKKDE